MYSQQIFYPKLICFNMLKYYLCLYLLFYLIQVNSQSTLLFKQGFETSGDNWPIEKFSTPPCTNGDDTWNYHNELNDILPTEGISFWGIQDLNGNCGSSDFEFIDLKTLNISTFRNVELSFEVQVIGFDNGDDMKYELWLDGKSEAEVTFIDGQNDFSTNSWLKIQIAIPNHVNEIKLRISIKQNGSDYAALDNIQLSGESIQPCQELFISEYIEGSSSSNHRNNYIELYNPSNDTINLSSYKLLKFTGSNLVASELELFGSLVPFETFLIEDSKETLNIEADLSTNNSVMDFNGDDKIALEKAGNIIDLIGQIGESDVFAKDLCLRRKSQIQGPNNQYEYSEWDVYNLDNTEDLNFHASQCEADFPEIEVIGLGQIIVDGSNRTSLINNTYFGAWPVSVDTLISRSFTIKNTGKAILHISDIIISGQIDSNFTHNFANPEFLIPNDSINLQVSYVPISPSINSIQLEILNNDPSEKVYNFKIQAEGTGPVNHPLIISQYYEGNANNKWLEIANTSNLASSENKYYLALFRNSDTENPIDLKPYRKILIPSIEPNQTLKFRATLNVTAPEYAIDGNEIKTAVCGFTGDDILIISTSGSESCWEDRTDIIGRPGNWGSNISWVRNHSCNASLANTGFTERNWMSYSINDIDLANNATNEMIGIHNSGATTWTNDGWSNGVPDINSKVFVVDNYTTRIHGDLQACSIHILKDASVNISSDDLVEIKNDLMVDGLLEIENDGSLIIIEDSANIQDKGVIKIHKTTTALNKMDYTYWSSPINNANLETVFEQSPKNSFFIFSTLDFEDTNNDGIDDNNDAWVGVSGVMEIGRGYTSMAPNTIPLSKEQKIIFQGKVNSGTIEIPILKSISAQNDEPSWNFIGNPYPSALNAELILNYELNKDLVYGTLYFWTHATEAVTDGSLEDDQHYSSSDYAMFTIGVGGVKANETGEVPTGFISSCQGFFIEAQKTGTLVLNNSMRSSEKNAYFFKPLKNNSENKIWLNLRDQNGAFSQILLGFINKGNDGFDKQFDGIRLISKHNLNFYSLADNERLGIQSLAPFKGIKSIKLGLIPNGYINKNLQISIDHILGEIAGSEVILSDKLLGKQHRLNLGPYNFMVDKKGPIDDRFELTFNKIDDIINTPLETKIKWKLMNDILIINTNNMDVIYRVEVFDLNGRKLRHLNATKTQVFVNWQGLPSRAIYILRIHLSDNRKFISKILI